MKKSSAKIIALLTLCILLPSIAMAGDFDYSNIISDEEASDYQTMTQVEIKSFLTDKGSYLKNYWYTGYNPSPGEEIIPTDQRTSADYKQRSAAEIIYNSAYEARINPQLLLTMLQKEMSLIEDSTPTDRQIAFAMGYYCFDGQSCNPGWRGFGKQVRATALQFRDYLDNIETRTYRPGKTSIIEGEAITPANNITAGLYNYTPHLHGNELFKTIWDRYDFGGSTQALIGGIIPDGSLVQARDGEDTEIIYLIYNNQKRPFDSRSALISRYDPGRVLQVASAELNKFSEGNTIKYSAYSILQGPNGNKYLLDGLTKRLIASDEVFRNLGFNPEEIIEVTNSELADIEDGDIILDVDTSPVEQLLRDTSNGGIYYAKDGKKYPIIDQDIIDINYPNLAITNATQSQLNDLQKLLPAKIKDGTLVKSPNSGQVYVISDGQRRWIENEETFIELGYSWSNIQEVNDRVFKLHKTGSPINISL